MINPANTNQSRRALVTGATGFVGSNLVRRLVSKGWDVSIIVRPSSKRQSTFAAESVNIFAHDGTIGGMTKILAESKPDVVFHLAAYFIAQHTPENVEGLIESNITFGSQLLEGMANTGINLLVNTGTSWQHYNNQPYSPVNLYAATKQAFESILQYYVEATPIRAITLMLFDTYGPNDKRQKLFHHLIKAIQSGVSIQMSPGEQLIDLVYIDDVVAGFLSAGDRLLQGNVEMNQHERFTISSGNPVKLREIVRIFGQLNNTTVPAEWGAKPYRPREVMVPWRRGKQLPGWKALIPLEEGFRRLLTL